jgi:hypothetical protein
MMESFVCVKTFFALPFIVTMQGSKSICNVFLCLPVFYENKLRSVLAFLGARGGVVVKALRHKPAGRGFDSRWCHGNFSVT